MMRHPDQDPGQVTSIGHWDAVTGRIPVTKYQITNVHSLKCGDQIHYQPEREENIEVIWFILFFEGNLSYFGEKLPYLYLGC